MGRSDSFPAEVAWDEINPVADPFTVVRPVARLRLVRAMAKSNHLAWRLLSDELGYHLDFVVALTASSSGRSHHETPDTSRREGLLERDDLWGRQILDPYAFHDYPPRRVRASR